jgi:hypothetical protein
MADTKTTDEDTRSPVDGTEYVRLATSGTNWKVTSANLAVVPVLKDQSFTGGVRTPSQSLSTGNVTIDPGDGPLQHITNGGAFTMTAPANDGSCLVLVTNNGSAGTITFSGFSVGSSVGDALTTTNTSKFSISVWRVNSVAGYRIAAHQ